MRDLNVGKAVKNSRLKSRLPEGMQPSFRLTFLYFSVLYRMNQTSFDKKNILNLSRMVPK